MAIFKANPGEKVLYTSNGFWNKTKIMACQATINITDQRIVVEKWANMNAGLLLQLIAKSTRAAIIFDKPLTALGKIQFKKKKALLGEVYRFTFDNNGTPITIQMDKGEDALVFLPNLEEIPWKE